MRIGLRAANPKVLVGVAISIAVLSSNPTQLYAFAGNGVGTSSNPYEITNCTQLQAVNGNLSASYELMNSIDCVAQTNFLPVSGSSSFTGSFDGNNYTIDNLTIDPAGNPDNVSLFGSLDGATIRDFTLDHPNITGGSAVGSIAGVAFNGATISGIKLLNGHVRGADQVGGFVGLLGVGGEAYDSLPVLQFSGSKNTTVSGSSSTTTISYIGGAVGQDIGLINHVSTEGSVIGNVLNNSMSEYVGGVAGVGGALTSTYSKATVVGGTRVGGLVGYVMYGLANSYSSGTVSGDSHVGGIAGESDLAITTGVFSDSTVTGGFATGAVFGMISANAPFVTGGTEVYDSVRSTQLNCGGYDERLDQPYECIDIAGQPNYFFNNDFTYPFYNSAHNYFVWDFVNDWQIQPNDYPLLRTKPVEPANVSVTSGTNSVTISWDTSSDALQAPITGYRLEYARAGETATNTILISDHNARSYTITGLDASTPYNLWLRAINQAGNGGIERFTASTGTGIIPSPSIPNPSNPGSNTPPIQPQPDFAFEVSYPTGTRMAQTTNQENEATDEVLDQPVSSSTDASSKPASSASDLLSDTTDKQQATGNAWWWLLILPVLLGIWFWRKHTTK